MSVRHFLRDDDLSIEEQAKIIKVASVLAKQPTLAGKAGAGKSIGLFFEKPSLRTRVSSETACVSLGAHPVQLKSDELHLHRGESAADSIKVLGGYLSLMLARVYKQELLEEFAEPGVIPVVNGLSDVCHPLQALADLLTLAQEWEDFSSKKLVYLGDGNNVAASLLVAGAMSKLDVVIACPKEYSPCSEVLERAQKIAKQTGANVSYTDDIDSAVKDADVLYTDVWASMGDEGSEEERKKALMPFQLTEELIAKSNNDSIVLHCLPAHPGEEITQGAFDSDRSRIIRQAHNRFPATAALFLFLLKPERFEEIYQSS